MRKPAPILAVLLGVSLLVNALTLSRLVRGRPDAPAEGRQAASGPKAAEAPEMKSLRDAVAAEKGRAEALQRRVEELEARGAHLPPAPAPGTPAAVAKSPAVLREKLRKFIKMSLSRRGDEGEQTLDPETARDIMDALSEYYPVILGPSSDPGRYAAFMEAVHEVTMDELGVPLSEEQRRRLSDLFAGARDALAALAGLPSAEQMLGELKAQRALHEGWLGILQPDQQRKLDENPGMIFSNGDNVRWISRDQAAKKVAGDWTLTFQLTEAQRPAAEAAARSFAEALQRLNDEYRARHGKEPNPSGRGEHAGAAEAGFGYEYRMNALRAQFDALRILEGALTPEQRSRMGARRPWEYRLHQPAVVPQPAPPPR